MSMAWLRSIRRTPWFAFGTMVVVALGTALSGTVFAVFDGVLLKPLPYPRADELFVVQRGPTMPSSTDRARLTAALPDVKAAAFTMAFDVGALVESRPVSLRAVAISAGFFEVLGVSPLFGGFSDRQFLPSSGPMPVLVTYDLWQRVFGGTQAAIGRRLPLAGAMDWEGRSLPAVEVVGVLPRGFAFPTADFAPDLLVPFAMKADDERDRVASSAFLLLRAPAGLSRQGLDARLRAVRLDPIPQLEGRDAVRLETLAESMRWFASGLWTSVAASLLLVMLASANAAGLGLARRRQQQREYAVRRALGAQTWTLVWLGVRESAPLVLCGIAAGLVALPSAIVATVALLPQGMSYIKPPAVDSRVVAFMVLQAVAMIATCAAVHLRAWTPPTLVDAMNSPHTTSAQSIRVAGLGLTAQVAVAVVLTTVGALAASSLLRLTAERPGFEVERTLLVDVSMASVARPARLAWLQGLAERVIQVPGVQSVGIAGEPPLASRSRSAGIRRPADALPGREQAVSVAGDFFATMGIAPLRGRVPTPQELSTGAPLAAVSERAAQTLWPNGEAVGQVLVSENGRSSWTVVGVVPEIQISALGMKRFSQIYRPFDGGGPTATLIVRTTAEPDAVLPAVSARLRARGDDDAVMRVSTTADALGETIRWQRAQGWIFGSFAATALLITAIGVLALAAMSTAARTREFGIRAALGATRPSLLWTSVRHPLAYVTGGVAVGLLGSAWAVSLLRRQFYEATLVDGRFWAVAIISVFAATTLGAVVPAMRAARIDAATTLRAE